MVGRRRAEADLSRWQGKYAGVVIFVAEPASAEQDAELTPIRQEVGKLWQVSQGNLPAEYLPRAGMVSPTDAPEVQLPVAVCGPDTPNRVLLVGQSGARLSQGALIAEKLASRQLCVVVARPPVSALDANQLAAVMLSDEPRHIIFIDPSDAASPLVRKVFSDRVVDRNRARATVAGAAPIGATVMGKAELAEAAQGSPLTVAKVIECVEVTLDRQAVSITAEPAPSRRRRTAREARGAVIPGLPGRSRKTGPSQA